MSLVLRVGYGGEGGFGCGVSCCAGVCCAGWDKDRSGGIELLVGFTIIWMGNLCDEGGDDGRVGVAVGGSGDCGHRA